MSAHRTPGNRPVGPFVKKALEFKADPAGAARRAPQGGMRFDGRSRDESDGPPISNWARVEGWARGV